MAKVAERYKYLTQQRADGTYVYRQGMFTYETYEDKAGNTRIKHDSIEFVDTAEGFIKLLREPVEGRYYTIGGDTAGSEVGADDKDFFAGQVIDSTTKEQMAIFHEDRIEDDEFGFQMYCLGMYYNEALIAIETNFSLVPTNLLAELNYSNLYMRETVDTSTHRVQKKYGVRTDKRTRPLMIAEAIKLVRDNVEQINDIGTLEEMMVFVRNDKGRAEAQNGKHDDLVMSLCISLYANSQQDKIRALAEPEKKTEIQKHKERTMKKVNSKHNKFARY